MITAKEAKELCDKSGKEVDEYLLYCVEPEVIKAASSGKRKVIIGLGCIETYYYSIKNSSLIQKGVLEKLNDLGYHASIETYGDSYVPKGLTDDTPTYVNYGFLIKW